MSLATDERSTEPIRVLTSAAVIPLPKVGVLPSLRIAGLKPVPVFQALSAEM